MTPEQTSHIANATSSLKAARLLFDHGMFGYSASRAYYSMYYIAQSFLLEDNLSFSKHSGVIAAFGQRFTRTGRVPVKFHRLLIDDQDLRNIGDYGGGPEITEEQAKGTINHAEEFIALAEQMLGSVP